MSEDGFVCLYFLVLFLLSTALIFTLLNAVQDRTRTAMNLRQANLLSAQEAAVLQFVKCELRNQRLEDGDYEHNGVSFRITVRDRRIDAAVFSPYSEILQITMEDDTHVYDYDVLRNETAA
ncbi:MAG: hypothetical protein IIZ10_02080 [Solobacterium sp.]|nr:hypothetical protein [Solobacterium sp.]